MFKLVRKPTFIQIFFIKLHYLGDICVSSRSAGFHPRHMGNHTISVSLPHGVKITIALSRSSWGVRAPQIAQFFSHLGEFALCFMFWTRRALLAAIRRRIFPSRFPPGSLRAGIIEVRARLAKGQGQGHWLPQNQSDPFLRLNLWCSEPLTLTILRLLSSKAGGHKDFWKPSKPCQIGIHWKAFAEYSQMSTHVPGISSFFTFFATFCIGQISY